MTGERSANTQTKEKLRKANSVQTKKAGEFSTNRKESGRYPQIRIDLAKLLHNVRYVTDRCREIGIDVAGVIKGTTALPPCIEVFARGGSAQIASSRMEQLKAAKAMNLGKELMMIRIPMLSEIKDVIETADISLNSERKVLFALNEEAGRQGKKHKVIVMADVGDLREGFWDKAEMEDVCLAVERDMPHLELLGIGTNVGCYGSVLPTKEKLEELVALARRIEKSLGRKLRYVSGAATSGFMRVMDGDMPEGINHLRIGEGILLARDFDVAYGYDTSAFCRDVYTLRAEVIEVKKKASYPQGTLGVDAFGRKPVYTDRGERMRALVALGRADYGDPADIFPKDGRIEVLGASSDHTILDVEAVEERPQVGDIIEFDIDYASMVYLTNSANVRKVYV